MGWTLADLSTEGMQRQVATVAESVMAASDDRHYRHDVDWALHEQETESAVKTFLLDEDGCRGLAVILKRERPIPFQIGEVTLFRVPMVRFDLWRYPIVCVAKSEHSAWLQQVEDLFGHLFRQVRRDGAIGIEGIPMHGPFWDFLQNNEKIKRDFLLLEMSPPYKHHYIKMPTSYEHYLGSLGVSSRRTLVKSINRLNRDFKVTLRSFEKMSELDAFLDDAIKISRKTYQWNLLGLGLRDRSVLCRRFHFAAERNWFRSYILYCDDNPVSFMIGYQYCGTYYGFEVGYDTDWNSCSVGLVLQMEVLRDLFSRVDRPDIFDFSTGSSDYKTRFANHEEQEINLLLMPRSLKNRLICCGYLSLNHCSSVAVKVLELLGIKRRIKKLLRFLSVRHATSQVS